MDINILPGINPDIDVREVAPIQQKRTLAFVNYFIIRTITFLNTFARSCESRFLDFENKLQKIEANICILESKLSSIPELNEQTHDENAPKEVNNGNKEIESKIESLPEINKIVETNDKTSKQTELENGIHIKDDPKYAKYFKMLHVGVPEEAVKLKMQADGLDPNLLSNPLKIIERSGDLCTDEDKHSDSNASLD